jgi:hypothetical protein
MGIEELTGNVLMMQFTKLAREQLQKKVIKKERTACCPFLPLQLMFCYSP